MASGIFISGTDTGIGKTRVSVGLVRALVARGVRAVGMKPVASGCEFVDGQWLNDDAQQLLQVSAASPDYAACNPFALPKAIAPHVAAAAHGVEITLPPIVAAYAVLARQASHVVVEGAGGWAVPLSRQLMQADIVHALRLPVILVVGLRLGCINHALLSARAIQADGCTLLGWVANRVDPAMLFADDTLSALQQRLPAPCLAVLDHRSDAAETTAQLAPVIDHWLQARAK